MAIRSTGATRAGVPALGESERARLKFILNTSPSGAPISRILHEMRKGNQRTSEMDLKLFLEYLADNQLCSRNEHPDPSRAGEYFYGCWADREVEI
jgi:hypothetical protein